MDNAGNNRNMVNVAETKAIVLPKEVSFDGDIRTLSQFGSDFIKFMNSHKLSGWEATPFLLSALTGRAAFFGRSLWKDDGVTNSYELLNRLVVKYASPISFKPEVQMLMSITQGYYESINDFVHRLWELAHKAYPEMSNELLSREVMILFCTGLYAPEAVKFMAAKQPEDLTQTVRYY